MSILAQILADAQNATYVYGVWYQMGSEPAEDGKPDSMMGIYTSLELAQAARDNFQKDTFGRPVYITKLRMDDVCPFYYCIPGDMVA